MKFLIVAIGAVVGSLIFSWGCNQGKTQNPAVYRLDPEIQENVFTMKAWEKDIDETKPGQIRMIGNGIWRKERYLVGANPRRPGEK